MIAGGSGNGLNVKFGKYGFSINNFFHSAFPCVCAQAAIDAGIGEKW
jgi:hypothetical protein